MAETSSPKGTLEKIVVNTSFGRLTSQANFDEKILPLLMKEFALITGQHPSSRKAKQSISGFKLRAGTTVGLVATLRGKRMRNFLEKLTKIALPRIRDFRGISIQSIDHGGNLNIGVKDHFVFPETSPDSTSTSFGVEITCVVRGVKNRENAIALYRSWGVPLKVA